MQTASGRFIVESLLHDRADHLLADDEMLELCDSLTYDPAATDTANNRAVKLMARMITLHMTPGYVENMKNGIQRWAARFIDELADTGKLNALGCAGMLGATKAKTMIVTVVTRTGERRPGRLVHLHFVRAREETSKPHTWHLLGPVDYHPNLLEIDNKESFHLLVSHTLKSVALRVLVSKAASIPLDAPTGGCFLWARPTKIDLDLSFLIAELVERFPSASVKDAQFVNGGLIAWLTDWQASGHHALVDKQFRSHLEKYARTSPDMRDDFTAFIELGGSSDTPSSRHASRVHRPAAVVRPSGRNNLPLSLQPLAILANQARPVNWWPWNSARGPIPFHCWSLAYFDARLVIHATEFSEFRKFSKQANQDTQGGNGCVYEPPFVWSNMNIDGDVFLGAHRAKWHGHCNPELGPGLDGPRVFPPLESFVVDARGEFLLCLSTPEQQQHGNPASLELPDAFMLFWVPIAELLQRVKAMGKDFMHDAFLNVTFCPASVRLPDQALLAATTLIEDARQYSHSIGPMLTLLAERSIIPTRLYATIILERALLTNELECYVYRGGECDVEAANRHWREKQQQLQVHRSARIRSEEHLRELVEEQRKKQATAARVAAFELRQREEREATRLLYERLVQRLSKRTAEAAIANLPVWQEARDRMARIQGLQQPRPVECAAERAERQRWLRKEAAEDKQAKAAFQQRGREAAKVQTDLAAAARRRHKATLREAKLERRSVRAAVRLVKAVEEQRIERERAALRDWHKEQERAIRRRRRIASARAVAQLREAEAIDRAARRAQKNALRLQRRAFRRLERGEPAEPAEPATEPWVDDGDGSGSDELPPLPAHLRIPMLQELQSEPKAPPSPATSTAPPSYPSTAVHGPECAVCMEEDPVWGRLGCGHMFCVDCGKKLTACPKCGKAIIGPPQVCFF
jgi:hypothetical protein